MIVYSFKKAVEVFSAEAPDNDAKNKSNKKGKDNPGIIQSFRFHNSCHCLKELFISQPMTLTNMFSYISIWKL